MAPRGSMTPENFTVRAPAKINLFLRITGRRPDGYHTLITIMQKIDLCDELVFERCKTNGIRLVCHGADLPADANNIVYRAATAFFRDERMRAVVSNQGVTITLKKVIPIAAGLGGGSSDAAATLLALNHLCDQPFTAAELAGIGLKLGADVPFFLTDASACLAEGIGEKLSPVEPLDGYTVLLVNPGFPVSTQWVYQTFALTNKDDKSIFKNFQIEGDLVTPSVASRLARPVNDLEKVTFDRYPMVAQVKAELLAQGAISALMSGSGPTVFGLFRERALAVAAFSLFKKQFEQVFLTAGIA